MSIFALYFETKSSTKLIIVFTVKSGQTVSAIIIFGEKVRKQLGILKAFYFFLKKSQVLTWICFCF